MLILTMSSIIKHGITKKRRAYPLVFFCANYHRYCLKLRLTTPWRVFLEPDDCAIKNIFPIKGRISLEVLELLGSFGFAKHCYTVLRPKTKS